MRDWASELRAIADGRLMLNVRSGVTVSRSMLAMIADEIDALRAAPLAPAEVGGLVERLREIDEAAMYEAPATTEVTIADAATFIQSQAARIAELEAGLGAMANEYIDYVEADMGRELRNGDLPPAWHRARALLNRRAEG